MGFFSELKSDLSQAVNTLMPDDEKDKQPDHKKTSSNVDLDSMIDRLDDIKLDDVAGSAMDEEESAEDKAPVTEDPAETEVFIEETKEEEPVVSAMDTLAALSEREEEEAEEDEASYEEPVSEVVEELEVNFSSPVAEPVELNNEKSEGGLFMEFEQQTATDETASITEGMVVNGDVETTGSLELVGKVRGNVKCLGKLNVTGEIEGDSRANEIYAEAARITGEVRSMGSVKIGQSTVIVGNIYAASAVVAGAVKGDIDVHGPVVLDTTAIVMGNIKSQSVQINNGAVIEGMCSQSYAEVNPSAFFEGLKNK